MREQSVSMQWLTVLLSVSQLDRGHLMGSLPGLIRTHIDRFIFLQRRLRRSLEYCAENQPSGILSRLFNI